MPTGFKYGTTGDEILENMKNDGQNIHDSLLAPWQKLDAVRMFVIPQITFHLKGGWVLRASLNLLDNFIRNCAKEWLKLPQQASTETLFLPHKVGGLNLMPLKMLADICDVVQAVHLLQSKDPLAKSTLQNDVKQHIKQPPSMELTQEYLNASTEGLFAPPFVSRSSIWTRLRLATRNLCKIMPMEWKCDNDGISFLMDKKPVAAVDAEKLLEAAFRCHLAKKLAAKPSQGKVFKVASLFPASNHFTYRGDYTTFAAWNFIHKARTNVVALNGCFMFPVPTQSCRKCGYVRETLPHVLNRW